MLGQRHIHEIHRPFAGVSILDGLRDADTLYRCTGAAIEPDVFAQYIDAWPIVFRALLIHHGDTRRLRGIGRQDAAATQNRNPQRLEVSFVNRIHRRIKILAIGRHLKTVRHEGNAVKALQCERRVLHESRALNSLHRPHTFGQQLVALLRLSCVVLHQSRIEAGHQQTIFRETDSLQQAMLETPGHQVRRCEQHQGLGNLRHHQHTPAPQAFASRCVNVGRLESVHQVHARALERRTRPQRSALKTDNARLASSTRVSNRKGMVTGNSLGMLKVRRNFMPPYPTAIPPNPPKHERIRLSVSSKRISRKRPAPMANRTAISRVRERARLKRSPATLVHATSRTASARITKTTMNFQLPSSARVRISKSVRTAAPRLRLTFGYSRSKFFASTASSLRACCSVVPRFKRACTCNSRSSRSSRKFFCGLVENIPAIARGM